MKLVIAEKPSVAMSIAKVIRVKNKKNGFIEGNGYIISWCVGHLIQMANPDKYDEKYTKWNIEDLPIIPKEYLYDVSKNTKTQYQVLKKLLTDKNISEVINACDAGREGELIFRLVYEKAKSKLPIKRLWISSMEDSAIKDGFLNLKRGEDYNHLYHSALARAKADWLIGMNMSRIYSCLYNQNYSVGRVQTPVLSMIAERDKEIKEFKKEKYFVLEIDLGDFKLKTDRIDEYDKAKELLNELSNTIAISDVIKKEKITKPDLLYDLTLLQREANKYFGFSAKETLDIAQSLYEKKLITYPRTDSRYLTEDMITSTINNILGKNDFDTKRIPNIFNSTKVSDHHAIIPTSTSIWNYDLSDLSEKEKNIYDLVFNKTHASVGYPLIEEETKIIYVFSGNGKSYEFKLSGKVIVDEGFSKYLKQYKKDKNDAEVILPNINAGDTFQIKDKNIIEKYTTPPKHYTEESILKAMEKAGTDSLDKIIEVERKGLGTPATRAGIIETLLAKNFIQREKKNLIATEKGIALVNVVSDFLKDANTTSIWEMKLHDISLDKYEEDKFLKEIEDVIFKEMELNRAK